MKETKILILIENPIHSIVHMKLKIAISKEETNSDNKIDISIPSKVWIGRFGFFFFALLGFNT